MLPPSICRLIIYSVRKAYKRKEEQYRRMLLLKWRLE